MLADVVIVDRFLAETTIEDECIDRCRGDVGAPEKWLAVDFAHDAAAYLDNRVGANHL